MIIEEMKDHYCYYDKIYLQFIDMGGLECCCFSHSAHWLPTRKKLLYTVANPARGLLNRGKKRRKKKVWQRPPPARARAARSEKKNKKEHAAHPHV